MTHTRSARSATAWFCLSATALLAQGCSQTAPGWNGVFAIDAAGGARTCSAPAAAPPDGQSVLAQMQVVNDGGWCGITANHNGEAYTSYLLVTHPNHGKVFAHRVGPYTRIDYTPDAGFAGTDSFAVRMIPGDSNIEAAVTVTR
jgi:hypothetical protein